MDPDKRLSDVLARIYPTGGQPKITRTRGPGTIVLDEIPKVGSSDFGRTGEHVGQAFCKYGYVLLKVRSHEQDQLTSTQAVLKSVTGDANHSLQPSKYCPGRLTYSFSLGQELAGVPECWSITAAKVCNTAIRESPEACR